MLFASGVVVMTDSVIPADNKPGQSPLPAFFYGGGDTGSGAMADASAAPPVPIDRRTLLGLVAGTGMLASVLFAGGVLIGASMFMSTPQEAAFAETGADPVPQEILIAPPPAETLSQQAEEADADDVSQAVRADKTTIGSQDLGRVRREVVSAPAPPVSEPPGRIETEIAALPQESPVTAPARPLKRPAGEQARPEPVVPPPSRTTRSGEIPLPPPAPIAKSAPFAIQIGAFRIRENADTELNRLADKGLDPLLVRRTSNDGNVWFYVRVGAYEDRARAGAAADRLKQTSAINGFPVRAEPGEVVLE